ncbi:MAG: hypothetical protein MZV70_04740 [Desulfobacterales bacterium]|nr:hypothetical protein [Desulfobacterales bacterium]
METEPQKILGKFTGNNIQERAVRHYRRLQPSAGARRASGVRVCADRKTLYAGRCEKGR